MLYLLLFLLAIITYIWKYYDSVRHYPKGPTPLPLVGNLHMFYWKRAHLQLSKLSQTYGGVFTIWLPRPFVVVTDYDVLKDAFQTRGDDFSERTGMFPDIAFMNVKNGGVLFSSGSEWREQRRIAITILRDFGMGKNLMETQIQDSVTDALKYWDTLDFDKFDVRWPIQLFVSNVIAKALFNFQFHSKGMDKMQLLSDKLQEYLEVVKDSKLFFISQTWPWATRIPFFEKIAFGACRRAVAPIKRIVAEMTEEAVSGYDRNQDPECLAQAYYQKIETNRELSYPQMVNVCMDFFIAGIETSSTILRWSCLYLTKHQDVQNKMRKEIEENLGFERLVQMQDKAVLPYCNAVIQEVMRCANIVPMNLVHRVARDSQIGGHYIPKNTFVYGQISHVLAHSSRYPDPEVFNPSRFLLDDGVTPNKDAVEHLVPFGIGKRQCAGEPLARMEIFTGLVTIIQKYKLEPNPGEEVDLEPIFGQILLPKQHFLKVSKV